MNMCELCLSKQAWEWQSASCFFFFFLHLNNSLLSWLANCQHRDRPTLHRDWIKLFYLANLRWIKQRFRTGHDLIVHCLLRRHPWIWTHEWLRMHTGPWRGQLSISEISPESLIQNWAQPPCAETLISLEHGPIDVIHQVNEAQCQ